MCRVLRGVVAAVLVAVTCVLLPLGAVSLWGRSLLTDRERYVATMAPLAEDGAVREAVSDAVAAEVGEEIDAGPLQDAVDSFVHQAVLSFSTTRAYRNAWDTANRAAHRAVAEALRDGDTGRITVELAPLVQELKNQLAADGVPFADNIPVRGNRVTVLRAEDTGRARDLIGTLTEAGRWLPPASLALAAAALAVARRRRRTLAALGLGTAAGAAALQLLTAAARRTTLAQLPPDVPRPAVGEVYDALTASLRTGAWWMLAVGLAVAGAAALWPRLGRVRDGVLRRRKLRALAAAAVAALARRGLGARAAAGSEAEAEAEAGKRTDTSTRTSTGAGAEAAGTASAATEATSSTAAESKAGAAAPEDTEAQARPEAAAEAKAA